MLGIRSLALMVALALCATACGTAVGGNPPEVTVLSSSATGSLGAGSNGAGGAGGSKDAAAAGASSDGAPDGGVIGDEVSEASADAGALSLSLDDALRAKSPDCLACAQRSCPNYITGCTTLPGMAKAGPAAGVDKADLCVEVVACVLPTGCAGLDLGACYCGVDHPDPDFKCDLPSPCSSALERGLESTDPFTVLLSLTDPTKAGGWALTLMQCLRDNQCADCLAPPPDDGGDDAGDDADPTTLALRARQAKGRR